MLRVKVEGLVEVVAAKTVKVLLGFRFLGLIVDDWVLGFYCLRVKVSEIRVWR